MAKPNYQYEKRQRELEKKKKKEEKALKRSSGGGHEAAQEAPEEPARSPDAAEGDAPAP